METGNELLARQLYEALAQFLKDRSHMGLLVAVADLNAGLSYDAASPKTRIVFRDLAVNLTRGSGKV
jgi:hypothetical protein